MKKTIAIIVMAVISVFTLFIWRAGAADDNAFHAFEYATIRWGGKENTHLIRPNSSVEQLGPLLTKVPRKDRTDERSFYMNIAMNAVAKEGYEFAGMTNDEIIMRRRVVR
jgi:hypothetical protein